MEAALQNQSSQELIDFLKKKPEPLNVVVMPDFFLDRIVTLEWDVGTFCRKLAPVLQNKGGNIDGVFQVDQRGGNAANTASALAALEVNVTPIICVSQYGSQLLTSNLRSDFVDLSHVKIREKPSMTTALEFRNRDGRANVMLRNLGSLAEFGPQDLDNSDYEAIEKADYVCIFNWAATKAHGTELAELVFRHASKKGKTYFDSADPRPRKQNIPRLISKVLQSKNLDILSVNENEAVTYASFLHGANYDGQGAELEKKAEEAAASLAKHISARIDLHTTHFSGTFTKNLKTKVPAFKVPSLRATGAGDAFNAGNILGDAHGLSDDSRLSLANAVAAYYVSSQDGSHPTRQKLLRFVKKHA